MDTMPAVPSKETNGEQRWLAQTSGVRSAATPSAIEVPGCGEEAGVDSTAMGKQSLKISLIVPAHNAALYLGHCLAAVATQDYPNLECIVVDDCSTDVSRTVASEFPVQLLSLSGGPFGPAYARNVGSRAASGEILFFIDSDVVVHHDVVSKVAAVFSENPDVDAVFGSYDGSPEANEFISQFKNLSHHFVHQHGNEVGSTFWSGCGAVRRDVFLETGGFDEIRYPRPSIEDIDLGRRLRAAGHKILLRKEIQVKHLKRWTLGGMTRTDIFYRGVPWTQLILQDKNAPNDLNLRFSQRISALLVYLMLADLGLIALYHNVATIPLLAGLFLVSVGNWYWPASKAPFRFARRAEAFAYVLLGAFAAIVLSTGVPWMLVPLAPLMIGLSARPWLPESRLLWNQAFFAAMVLGFISALALSLIGSPVWLLAPLLAMLATILLLNYQLFAFFVAQRGEVFALAAIPFQLLYYFCSVLAFGLGFWLHLWHERAKHQPKPRSVVRR